MKQDQIKDAIGKLVVVNPMRDIGMDPSIRRIIGKDSTLIKQCKGGLLQVEHEGRFYSVPPINVDLKAI
jgi:hypothetical protein